MKPKKPGKCEHDRGKFWDCGNAGIVEKILYPNCPYDSKKPKCKHLHPAGRLMFGRCGSCGKMVDETKTKRKPKRKPSDTEMLDFVLDECVVYLSGGGDTSLIQDRDAIRAAMKAEEKR